MQESTQHPVKRGRGRPRLAHAKRRDVHMRVSAGRMVLLGEIADRLLLTGGRAGLARMAIDYWLANAPEARQVLSRIGYGLPGTNA